MVHALKTLRPYLLDKPFQVRAAQCTPKTRACNGYSSSASSATTWHAGSTCSPASRRLDAEYQRVVHIPGRTSPAAPADFLTMTRKRFSNGFVPALSTGYDEADSELKLFSASPAAAPAAAFVHVGGSPTAPSFLHADFDSALRATLPADPTLAPIAAAALVTVAVGTVDADGTRCCPAWPPRCSFAASPLRSSAMACCTFELRSPRGDRLCNPEAGGLGLQVLQELHSTPLGWHFGRDKTLAGALASRSVWWPGLTAARNCVASVFRDVGLPNVLVSDSDTLFTSAFWTSLHGALGASLIFGSPPHTTSTVKRVNGVNAASSPTSCTP